MKRILVSSEAPEPAGAYAQGVKAGPFVFVSGQIALDPQSGEFVGGDIRKQTRQVLENLKAVMQAGGCSLAGVVKTTVFLTDLGDYRAVDEIFSDFFAGDLPSRELVEVSALPRNAEIEISAIGLTEL